MPNIHEGGCLCSDIRYKTAADPVRVTYPEHALRLDGTPNQPIVLAHAMMVKR